jgi:hypothetical protein
MLGLLEILLFCFIVTVIDLITQEEEEEFSMVSAWKNR